MYIPVEVLPRLPYQPKQKNRLIKKVDSTEAYRRYEEPKKESKDYFKREVIYQETKPPIKKDTVTISMEAKQRYEELKNNQ